MPDKINHRPVIQGPLPLTVRIGKGSPGAIGRGIARDLANQSIADSLHGISQAQEGIYLFQQVAKGIHNHAGPQTNRDLVRAQVIAEYRDDDGAAPSPAWVDAVVDGRLEEMAVQLAARNTGAASEADALAEARRVVARWASLT